MMWRAVLLLCWARFMLQEKPTLSPAFSNVLVNTSLELTCNARMNTPYTQWGTLNRSDIFSFLTFSKEVACITDGFLKETNYFETMCYRNATFTVMIKKVNISNHGQGWYCSDGRIQSNTAYITVQVPTKYVSIKNISGDIIKTVEKTKTALTCETSEGRPAANITWTKVSRTGITTALTNVVAYNISTREILSENNMIIVQSSINIVPSREDNDTCIICQAKNMELTLIKKEVTIIVQYPPSEPLFYVNDKKVNGSIHLISGKNVSVLCRSDSFPYPTYIWHSASSEYVGQYLNLSNIIRNDTWQCTTTNNITLPDKTTITGKSSAKLEIHLSYQREEVMFYVIGHKEGKVIEVTENETIIFNCSVDRHQGSETILLFNERKLWRNVSTNTLIHAHRVTSCLDTGVYKCAAKTKYNSKPSFKELKLVVRCTPILFPDFDLKIYISSRRRDFITFQYKAFAYPTPEFLWLKRGGSTWNILKNSNNKCEINTVDNYSNLTIMNITDGDYGYYKLKIKNDVGSAEQIYFLKANVPPIKLHFGLLRKIEGLKFTVNIKENISFMCVSNTVIPSDIVIKKQDGEHLAWTRNATSIRHNINEVSCVDAGKYECSARNISSLQREAISNLTLIVKCPPMPSAKSNEDNIYFSVLHSDVTLQFEVYEFFDEPNNTVFIWYKQNLSLPNDGRKYIITSYGFQSNLVIRNLKITDFGQYRLLVRNSYGQYIHLFELQEREDQDLLESTTARILLVAVGVFVFIIIAIVFASIGFRHIRRERSERRRTVEVVNQTTSSHDDNDTHYCEIGNVYEQLDEQMAKGADYIEMRSIKSENSTEYYITPTV